MFRVLSLRVKRRFEILNFVIKLNLEFLIFVNPRLRLSSFNKIETKSRLH